MITQKGNAHNSRFSRLFKNRRGIGSIMTILGAAVAAAVIVFPLARWQMSLSSNVANVSTQLNDVTTKLEALSVLEDRWRQINDMNIDEFKTATTKTTDYGKFKVTEQYSTGVGIYQSNGTCSGTYVDNGTNRACRKVTLTVQDAAGNVISSAGPATRVASADNSGGMMPDYAKACEPPPLATSASLGV